MPYMPEPTPPYTTSPSSISHIGIMPPSGVNESCMAFTAPVEVAVVEVAHRAELAIPNRTSLPSILPPDCKLLAFWLTPSAVIDGLPCCSAQTVTDRQTTKITVMAASMAQPLRVSPTILPKV